MAEQKSATDLVWRHVASHPGVVSHPALVNSILDAEDSAAATAELLCGGRLDDATALRAAKVLAPRRGARLPWDLAYRLRDETMPVPVQRHLAKFVGFGLETLWPSLTDPGAVVAVMLRVFPAKAPIRVDSSDRRPASAAVVPLFTLEHIVEGDGSFDEALLNADFFEIGLARLADYSVGDYASRVRSLLLTVAKRNPERFCVAAAEVRLTGSMLKALASKSWIDDALVARVFEHAMGIAGLGSLSTLRNIEPRLEEPLRDLVRDRVRSLDAAAVARSPFARWASKLLSSAQPAKDWTTVDVSKLLEMLTETENRVPDDVALTVIGRADLPVEVALEVAKLRRMSEALLACRGEREYVVGLAARSTTVLHYLCFPVPGSPVAERWTEEERLSFALEGVAGAFRSESAFGVRQGTEVYRTFKEDALVGALGAQRVLSLPWWLVASWAEENTTVSRWVGGALLDVLADAGTRRALVLLLEDAYEGRTELSLPDLVCAAAATAA